jgi:hypothetical protein
VEHRLVPWRPMKVRQEQQLPLQLLLNELEELKLQCPEPLEGAESLALQMEHLLEPATAVEWMVLEVPTELFLEELMLDQLVPYLELVMEVEKVAVMVL